MELTIGQVVKLLTIILFAFIAIYMTILDRAIWPISSFNVFNRIPPAKVSQLEAIVLFEDGTSRKVSSGQLLPIEFFNARSTINTIFLSEQVDSIQQFLLAEKILTLLNNKPWSSFDETQKSARHQDELLVSEIIFVLNTYDFTQKISVKEKPDASIVIYEHATLLP